MSEDIREILDKLEIVARKRTIEVREDGSKIETMPACLVDELRLNNYSAKILYDYITNLQEENEHTNYCNEQLRKKITNLEYKINTFEDYKSRCAKALAYTNMTIEPIEQQPSENDEWILSRLRGVKYTLQGSDKE